MTPETTDRDEAQEIRYWRFVADEDELTIELPADAPADGEERDE